MRISDWSSDVCSSDLAILRAISEQSHQLAVRRQARETRDRALERRAVEDPFESELFGGGGRGGGLDGGRQEDVTHPSSLEAARQKKRARTFALAPFRSEEHTSELQSLMRISYAVIC